MSLTLHLFSSIETHPSIRLPISVHFKFKLMSGCYSAIIFVTARVYLPARMFSTALATMKFLSETSPWIGFSSRLGTAALGGVARVIFATIFQNRNRVSKGVTCKIGQDGWNENSIGYHLSADWNQTQQSSCLWLYERMLYACVSDTRPTTLHLILLSRCTSHPLSKRA